jgi:hypothetical protein
LPHPATFVIDPKGIVRWKFIEVDYKKRASNEQIKQATKMEAGDPSVSLDLLIRSLISLGATQASYRRS